MSHREAAVYRQRAAHLRALARQIADSPSMTLHLHAGVDTWYGPRADACTTELASAQHTVREAVDELHTQSFVFDRHAEELEAAALRAELEADSALQSRT